jgi:hypothetical protein
VSGLLWAALGILGGLGMTAVGDMVSEEVRDRLDHLPHVILRLAALRLDPEQRVTIYDDEWMPELTYILTGDETRPITRLYHGTRYAIGILAVSGRLAKQLHRAQATPVQKKLGNLLAAHSSRIERMIASAPKSLLIAVGLAVPLYGIGAGFLLNMLIEHVEWFRNLTTALGFCVSAIVIFLCLKYRARIRVLVTCKIAKADHPLALVAALITMPRRFPRLAGHLGVSRARGGRAGPAVPAAGGTESCVTKTR